jgi:hypothetical protein
LQKSTLNINCKLSLKVILCTVKEIFTMGDKITTVEFRKAMKVTNNFTTWMAVKCSI